MNTIPTEAQKRIAEEALAGPGKAACKQQVIEAPTHNPVSQSAASQSAAELTIGPEYTKDSKEWERATGAAEGVVHELTIYSADCKSYPGVARKDSNKEVDDWIDDERFRGLGLTQEMWISEESKNKGFLRGCALVPNLLKPGVQPYQRKVLVHVPAGLDTSVPAPFLVVNDGVPFAEHMVPMLDILISHGRVPAIVTLFVDSGGEDAQGSQRCLEYDTVSGDFADFVENEVVPLVSEQCGLLLSTDPEGRAIMGVSSGGAGAFSMAWFRPELFRRVLGYSPGLVNQQYPLNPHSPLGAWDYHSGKELVANSEHKPLRICIYNMECDFGSTLAADTCRNLTEANRRMAAVLSKKGYAYRHVFCKGAEHVDLRVLGQTLPSALEWLWQGYGPNIPSVELETQCEGGGVSSHAQGL